MYNRNISKTQDKNLEKLYEKLDSLYEKENKVRKEIDNYRYGKLREKYQNKFIKITGIGQKKYLLVHTLFLDDRNNIVFRGAGFGGNFSDYVDNCYGQWDLMMDVNIGLHEDLDACITEITKEEYINAFDIFRKRMLDHQNSYIENYDFSD